MAHEPEQNNDSPATLMEGVGKLFAVITLLLRGLAIAAICFFLWRFIEPLLH